jgi:hypothetical protein
MKLNRKILSPFLGLVLASASAIAAPTTVSTGEPWKSYHPANNFTLGASTGFGLVDTHGGFSLIGNAAAKIVKDGFVPEIVNPVFLEVEFGPIFVSGATFWMYSTHLRWDFVRNEDWTLFALGGFGGNIASNKYGDRTAFHPRFGVGAFYALEYFDLRMEFSHELITIGMSVPF